MDRLGEPSRLAFAARGSGLFVFSERRIIDPLSGFYDLDDGGRSTVPGYGAASKLARYIFATSRIIHAYAIAYLMVGQAWTSLSTAG